MGKSYKATIEYIAPKGKETNGTLYFEVRAAVEVPAESELRAGFSANAEVVLDGVYNQIAIPESVVSYSDGVAYVELVTSEDPLQTEQRQIATGFSDGIYVAVLEGLQAGDKVKGQVL